MLTSVGIAAEVVHHDGSWLLAVVAEDAPRAASELDAYRQENPEHGAVQPVRTAVYAGAVPAILAYAVTIMLIAMFSAQGAFGLAWLAVGRTEADSIMAGQWWRSVTALTLHLDAGHLVSNLIFGAIFGLLAGRILGGGVAWLAIVLAGALGNLINAAVQPPTHASIGASTAVFAALGIIVSHTLRARAPAQEKRLLRWSPLIGGILLLGFIGVGGERTDVAAHISGFLAGLAIGWAGYKLPPRWLSSDRVQRFAGLATIAMVALAWLAGFTLAN